MELNKELADQISSTKLNNNEDLNSLVDLCKKINPTTDFISPMFHVLENNSEFNFGNPGGFIRLLEMYYKDPVYEKELFKSVKRHPTEYNLWILNRLLNTYNEDQKNEGISLLKEIVQNDTIPHDVREWAKEFLDEQE